MVSVVTAYGRQHPNTYWDQTTWPPMVEAIKAAEEFDKASGEPECADDGKAEWQREIESRIASLEAAAWRAANAGLETQ